jgi:hypothetical protein
MPAIHLAESSPEEYFREDLFPVWDAAFHLA